MMLRVRQDEGGSDREWGALATDYIPKSESACSRCSQRRYRCALSNYTCEEDGDIKYDYNHGRTQNAIKMMRDLPSEMLKGYLCEERRTPIELKAVILDELQAREKEEVMRL